MGVQSLAEHSQSVCSSHSSQPGTWISAFLIKAPQPSLYESRLPSARIAIAFVMTGSCSIDSYCSPKTPTFPLEEKTVRTSIRILVVDDYEPWRRFERLTCRGREDLEIIGECSDGDEAVQKAAELSPDLILLDISLPTLNGIEAARRIRQVSPKSKVLFVTENRSPDIAEEAFSTGAGGYVVKSDAARELLPG